MIKKFYILLFLLPFFVSASPKLFKTGSRPRLQFGGQIGANVNYFIYKNGLLKNGLDKDGLQKDVSVGYQGGMFLRISRKKAFAQFEINMMRSTINLSNGIFNNQFGQNISYDKLKFKYYTVGIPLIFGGYAIKKPLYKLRLYTGLEAQFITKTNVFISQNTKEFYKLKRNEKREILRPAQISYLMGSGMDIAMFIFDVKYSVSMTSFFKENYRTQTNLFQFTVGMIF